VKRLLKDLGYRIWDLGKKRRSEGQKIWTIKKLDVLSVRDKGEGSLYRISRFVGAESISARL